MNTTNTMSAAMKSKHEAGLLAAWKMAQKMVAESRSETASPWERRQYAVRMERATAIGKECIKAGLLEVM